MGLKYSDKILDYLYEALYLPIIYKIDSIRGIEHELIHNDIPRGELREFERGMKKVAERTYQLNNFFGTAGAWPHKS